MTVYFLMELCMDASTCIVTIFDGEKDGDVWTGAGDDIPEEYGMCEVASWDVPERAGRFTINI